MARRRFWIQFDEAASSVSVSLLDDEPKEPSVATMTLRIAVVNERTREDTPQYQGIAQLRFHIASSRRERRRHQYCRRIATIDIRTDVLEIAST